ncbi:MAG TPA: DUF2264 domain-containing protein [Streptomyces sp.]
MREAGGPWSATDIEEDLAVHASLRRPGGWLSDGQERAYDHYTGWALHLYPLLWTHLFDVTGTLCPPALRSRWEGDLGAYLDDALCLLGSDGSPLLQGRSLTYRFAAAAPLWVGALTGAGGAAPGLVRRAASGMLRHFHHLGTFEPDGLLRLGWRGEWLPIRQAYSGPGSPYWAAKGMLGLMLPADHPVWMATEEPLPVEKGDVARVVRAPGWLVSARQWDGVAVVVNHGTDHARPDDTSGDSPLYARLGYSSATVPPLVGPTTSDPLDNSVVVLDDTGRATHRSGFTTLFVGRLPGDVLVGASRSRVRWVDAGEDGTPDHGSGRTGPHTPGPLVTVASVLHAGTEVRLVRLDDADGPSASWQSVRLGGWPVPSESEPAREPEGEGVYAEVRGVRLRSRVCSLRGFSRAGTTSEPDTSPLAPWTAVPWLATAEPPPPSEVLAASVRLDRGAGDPPEPTVSVRDEGNGEHHVTVEWPDGVRADVTLPAP